MVSLEEMKEKSYYSDFMKVALEKMGVVPDDIKAFMPIVMKKVVESKEKDPVLMLERILEELRGEWTASENIPLHGPWHHIMVPGVIVAALRNNGNGFTDEDVKEALKRGTMIPGGTCGFHGTCGAAVGLGIAISIVTRSTPYHDDERSMAMEAVKRSLDKIGRLGGPRCCRLSAYAALEVAGKYLEEKGYNLPISKRVGLCPIADINKQCHGPRCRYYPNR